MSLWVWLFAKNTLWSVMSGATAWKRDLKDPKQHFLKNSFVNIYEFLKISYYNICVGYFQNGLKLFSCYI